jgi:DMATS type aromatic prenyltransferase
MYASDNAADSQEFWHDLVHTQASTLLESVNPDNADKVLQKLDHQFGHGAIFGPRPSQSIKPWPSYVADDRTPIEYSLSIAAHKSVFRVLFEPVSDLSGTSYDPLNVKTANQWLEQAQNTFQVDHALRNQLNSKLVLQDVPTGAPAVKSSQELYAFDVNKDELDLKIYLCPDSVVGNVDIEKRTARKDELVSETLNASPYSGAWSLISEYLSELNQTESEASGHLELLGWDAQAGKKGQRMKVYARFCHTDLALLLNHLDLGGRVKSERIDEIKAAAQELWTRFGSDDVSIKTTDMADLNARTRAVILAYELQKDETAPTSVKCEH